MDARAKAAIAAWDRYRSTVCMGGTREQRRWAFDQALDAEDKLAKVEQAEQERARRQKAAAALHGA